MGVALKVLVKKGPLGIHFLKKGILTKQGTYITAILGTGIFNNYQMVLGKPLCKSAVKGRIQPRTPHEHQ